MHPLNILAASGQVSPTPLSAPLDSNGKRSGIYCIWMPADPKHRVYVGQTVNAMRRLSRHRSALRNSGHATSKLQRAYRKYGESVFVWALVENMRAANTGRVQSPEHIAKRTATRAANRAAKQGEAK